MTKTETAHNKLVRDRICEIIINQKCVPVTRTLDNDFEFESALYDKFDEELDELKVARTEYEVTDELADLVEVINSLAILKGITLEDVLHRRHKKAVDRGGFNKRTFLETVHYDTDWEIV